ncbi:MAG: hypothetical protein J3Q66DRAFT_155574 [Benniella sp.]|nr:MAG: hypothetical protein J3Q66DRAFT_155574 [Benniella sp.]
MCLWNGASKFLPLFVPYLSTSCPLITYPRMARHATDLPELRQHFARYLDLDSLKACSLVCKAWHLDFHSVLWRHFCYKVPKNLSESAEELSRWLDIASRKAYLFRHVYHKESRRAMVPEISDILLERCHGLITIEAFIARVKGGDPVRYWEETLRPLVEQNKVSIQRLLLREVIPTPMISFHMPSLLSGLPRLQSLELGMVTTLEDLLQVLDACSTSLKCFDLLSSIRRRNADQESSAPDQQKSPSQSIVHQAATTIAPPLRLKRLGILGGCYNGTLWDILSHIAAHYLESLQVNAIIDTPFAFQVSPTLRDKLSRLTDLHVKNRQPKDDPLFPVLLAAIPLQQLRNLHMGAMDVECTTMLIDRHHQSLETLTVHFVQSHAGALGDILATCSKLKSLDFGTEPFVDIRTLIDPQKPWVCTELEVFEGIFGLSPCPSPLASNENNGAEDSKQEDEGGDGKVTTFDPVTSDLVESLFMQRVGRLTKLRRFMHRFDIMGRLFSDYTGDEGKDVMAWTLFSGLTHLADLVNLEWLEFLDGDLPEGISIPELVFFKQHWTSLRGLACYNMDAVEVKEWLATEWPELQVVLNHT